MSYRQEIADELERKMAIQTLRAANEWLAKHYPRTNTVLVAIDRGILRVLGWLEAQLSTRSLLLR